jgi:signal transduction histidine kinase
MSPFAAQRRPIRGLLVPGAIAIGLTIVSQVEIWLLWAPDPDEARVIPVAARLVAALAAAPFTLSLGLGRRLPLLAALLAIPAVALAPAGPLETSVAVAVAIALAAFLAAEGARGPIELGAGAVTVAAIGVTTAIAHPDTVEELGDIGVLALVLGGPWLAGLALRMRRRREDALEAAAARSVAAIRAESAAGAAEERSRIARELHDVVAHAISVIVLQARGARRSLQRDPAAAAGALDAIEATATNALGEMRRLVGVVRRDDQDDALEPPPGLGQLEALVAGVRNAGLPVDIRVEGAPMELPAGMGLTVYRVVQEALANVMHHAASSAAHVVIRHAAGSVEVEVTDTGPGALTNEPQGFDGRGHGTIGMRERAALYGGTVESGPAPGGGFRVLLTLPLEGDAG